LTEIAVYHLGGTVVPLSRGTGASRIKEASRELEVKFVFIEDPGLLDDIGDVLEELPGVLRATFFQGVKTKNENVLNFRSFLKLGLMKRKKLQDELKKVSDEIDADAPAAIFLNPEKSGGKSDEITQGDIMSTLKLISSKTNGIGDEDQSFSYISSASPYSKIINYLTLYIGTRAATAESREDFYQDIREVMPTMLFETSEGLEGLYKKSVASLDGLTPEKKLRKDLGSRVSYIFTDTLPASDIESIYRGAGAKFSLVPV